MKFKLLIELTLLLLNFDLIAQGNNEFKINGKVDSLKDGASIYLIKYVNRIPDTVCRTQVMDCSFFFRGIITNGADFYFIFPDSNVSKDPIILLLDDSKVEITGTIREWPKLNIIGSKANSDFKRYIEGKTKLMNEFEIVNKKLRNINNQVDSNLAFSLRKQRDAIVDSIAHYRKTFISENPNSFYTPFLIRTTSSYSFHEMESAYNSLSNKVKDSKFGIQLKEYLGILKNKEEVIVGGKIPSFTARTPNGKTFSLDDIVKKSKLTLVNFWASWCKPCRDENSELRRLYNKYKDKGFSIIGFSADNNKKAWVNAIKIDKISWVQVSDLKGTSYSPILKIYNIIKLPTSFLIDSHGKIIGIDLDAIRMEDEIKKMNSSKNIDIPPRI